MNVCLLPLPQALGSHGNSAVEVDRDTVERMGRIQASYRGNREVVLGELLRRVCDIQPEFHINYRVAGWARGERVEPMEEGEREGAERRPEKAGKWRRNGG